MAIATSALVAGGLAAAGAIGGAAIGSGAQKSAAKQANQAQQQATQAQLQLGRESMGLNRDIYNSNYALLSPFVANGLTASNALNALLGLPASQPMQSPLAQQPQTGVGTGTVPGAQAPGAQVPPFNPNGGGFFNQLS